MNNFNNIEKEKTVFICGFSPEYREMLYALLSPEFSVDEKAPELIISEENQKLSASHAKIITIGKRKEKNKEGYFCRPLDLSLFKKFCIAFTSSSPVAEENELLIDQKKRSLRYGGKSTILTKTEFALFMILYEKNGEKVKTEFLREKLWKKSESSNIAAVYIHYLKNKLENVFGVGCITAKCGEYIMKLPK